MAIRALPLTAQFGAEVLGTRIAANPSPELISQLRAMWVQHKILLIRGPLPAESDLVSFSRALGQLEIHVRTEFLSPDNPELLYVSNIKRDGKPIGILSDNEVGWHYDQIYLPRPAVGSLLCAVTIPPTGGRTHFSDMSRAWELLPAELKQKIEGRRAVQSYEAFNSAYSVPTNDSQKKRTPDIEQPIVRTHPITGRKALYICPGMTTRVVGLSDEDSRSVLDALFAWIVRDEFVYSHEWRVGDCLLWDNACTMHKRDPFDSQYERLMKRTTILPPEHLAVPF